MINYLIQKKDAEEFVKVNPLWQGMEFTRIESAEEILKRLGFENFSGENKIDPEKWYVVDPKQNTKIVAGPYDSSKHASETYELLEQSDEFIKGSELIEKGITNFSGSNKYLELEKRRRTDKTLNLKNKTAIHSCMCGYLKKEGKCDKCEYEVVPTDKFIVENFSGETESRPKSEEKREVEIGNKILELLESSESLKNVHGSVKGELKRLSQELIDLHKK